MSWTSLRTAAGVVVAALLIFTATSGNVRAAGQTDAGDPYPILTTADFGGADDAMAAIAKEVTDAKPDQYPAIEQKLIHVLEATDATVAGRQFACRLLKLVGSAKCVPVLGKLLADEKLSHMARYALGGIKDASVGELLCDALGKSTGSIRIGIMNSLADRRDTRAVALLAKLSGDADRATAVAAIRAIGRTASPEAANVLMSSDSVDLEWCEAGLLCGQRMLADGQSSEARALFNRLSQGRYPSTVRAAALTGIVHIDQEKALPEVFEALNSDDRAIRQGAAAAAIEIRNPAANALFASDLPKLSPVGKTALLCALASRGQREGLTPAVNAAIEDPDAEVSRAAIVALRPLGDASSVPALAAALKSRKDFAADITETLKVLFADGVAEALIKQTESGDEEVRVTLIGVLGDRREAKALPLAIKGTTESSRAISQASIKAVGALGGTPELELLLATLLKNKQSNIKVLQQAMSAIIRRNPGAEAPVIKAMDSVDADTQLNLMTILKVAGGSRTLEVFRKCLASNQPDVKKAALRDLADWPDESPMNDLKALARDDSDESNRILALRGFIRQIGLDPKRNPKQSVPLYTEALALAQRPQEKIQIIGGLGNIKDVLALKAVQALFGDPAVKNDAMNAALKISGNIGKKSPKECRAALQQIVQQTADAGLRKRAKSDLNNLSN